MRLNKSDYCNTPKYLTSSYKFNLESANHPNLTHTHTISSISNKENTYFQENIENNDQNQSGLLENLFKKLNYFSNSSQNFLKSAEKLSKHLIKEPIAERNFKNYELEKRKMENSLDVIVIQILLNLHEIYLIFKKKSEKILKEKIEKNIRSRSFQRSSAETDKIPEKRKNTLFSYIYIYLDCHFNINIHIYIELSANKSRNDENLTNLKHKIQRLEEKNMSILHQLEQKSHRNLEKSSKSANEEELIQYNSYLAEENVGLQRNLESLNEIINRKDQEIEKIIVYVKKFIKDLDLKYQKLEVELYGKENEIKRIHEIMKDKSEEISLFKKNIEEKMKQKLKEIKRNRIEIEKTQQKKIISLIENQDYIKDMLYNLLTKCLEIDEKGLFADGNELNLDNLLNVLLNKFQELQNNENLHNIESKNMKKQLYSLKKDLEGRIKEIDRLNKHMSQYLTLICKCFEN